MRSIKLKDLSVDNLVHEINFHKCKKYLAIEIQEWDASDMTELERRAYEALEKLDLYGDVMFIGQICIEIDVEDEAT